MEEIRSLMTLAAFSSFVGIVWWAYAPRRKKQLDAVAESILKDDA
jgi:cbb3-type cytochrome oxidase subunit 3